MSGLFAQRQFGYGTYNLDPLRTSEPEVGATLPKAKAKTPTTEDPVGAKVPSKAVAGGTAAAAAAGAAEVAAASTNKSLISAPVSAGASANVINGQISKHMALDANADSRAEAATTQAGVSAPVTNTTSGASLPIPSPEWGIKQTQPDFIHQTATSPHTLAPAPAAPATSQTRGGLFGSLENWGSSITNQVDHAMYSPNSPTSKPADPYEQNKYNQFWHGSSNAQAPYLNTGATSAAAASGGVQGLSSGTSINKTTDSGVTEPSNVWNPSTNLTNTQASGNGYSPRVALASAPYSANAGAIGSSDSEVPAVGGGATPKAISPFNYNAEFERLVGENNMSQSPRSGNTPLNAYQFSGLGEAEGLANDQEMQAEMEAELEASAA